MQFTGKRNTTIKSPISFFLNWKGGVDGGGHFEYYDKELAQKISYAIEGKKMIVLRIGTSVTGFSKASGKGIWSNEVEKADEIITVRTAPCDKHKEGIIAEGKWKDIKDKVENAGGKYQRALTVLCDDKIIGLGLFGSGIGNWFDITKDDLFKIQTNYLVQKSSEKSVVGKIEFIKPVYEFSDDISEKDIAKAVEAGGLVNNYYKDRKNGDKPDVKELVEEYEIPFE